MVLREWLRALLASVCYQLASIYMICGRLTVDGAAGVVESCLFLLCLVVQVAVTVTVVVAGIPGLVLVTSLMGTKVEQNADAFIA